MLDVDLPLSLNTFEDLQHDRGIRIAREISSRRPPLHILNRLWMEKVRRQALWPPIQLPLGPAEVRKAAVLSGSLE